jgi:hypothetical protein
MYKLSLSSKLFDYLLFVGAQPQLLSLSMSFFFVGAQVAPLLQAAK